MDSLTLPELNEDYAEKNYWDKRFESEETYDWFADFKAFRHLLREDLKENHKILMLGCGNSLLSEHLYTDGFKHITNIDYSKVVIEKMKKKYVNWSEMTWKVMDILDMSFDPVTFDIVLEKGTLDALLVNEKDPWQLSGEGEQMIDTVLKQVSAILKPGGKFISITFSQPHFRKPLYARERYNWSVQTKTFGETFHFFYFSMTKGEVLTDEEKKEERKLENRKLKSNNTPTVYLKSDDSEDFLCGIDL
ncbi:hypothetical protein ACJMK2_008697 [Sinanodonta woodiana]|uniref:EEF1A lysine methyltransferase 4 n=2 Tax=Sinanodonta woodiana TaxID=1069815 RepID=A0ABD3VMC9_SINWO